MRTSMPPEEAERTKNEMATLRECKSIVEHQRNEHREEVERLRKELERRETHHKELHNANEQLSASLTSADNRYYLLLDATEKCGLVSEEECARRCREVAIEYAGAMPYQPLGDLAAIIDRVAKGGAR